MHTTQAFMTFTNPTERGVVNHLQKYHCEPQDFACAYDAYKREAYQVASQN